MNESIVLKNHEIIRKFESNVQILSVENVKLKKRQDEWSSVVSNNSQILDENTFLSEEVVS